MDVIEDSEGVISSKVEVEIAAIVSMTIIAVFLTKTISTTNLDYQSTTQHKELVKHEYESRLLQGPIPFSALFLNSQSYNVL